MKNSRKAELVKIINEEIHGWNRESLIASNEERIQMLNDDLTSYTKNDAPQTLKLRALCALDIAIKEKNWLESEECLEQILKIN